jgi:hypothetical protein
MKPVLKNQAINHRIPEPVRSNKTCLPRDLKK